MNQLLITPLQLAVCHLVLGQLEKKNINLSYQVSKVSQGRILVVFLDTTSYYNSSQALLSISILLSMFGFIFFVVIVSALSGIVIRPFIRNYEKQRRFITNASHELKTPLAIISANTELQELMTGENEWTKSTNDQVARLTNLINSLVALSRLEEQPDIVLQDVDFSYITEDVQKTLKVLLSEMVNRLSWILLQGFMLRQRRSLSLNS